MADNPYFDEIPSPFTQEELEAMIRQRDVDLRSIDVSKATKADWDKGDAVTKDDTVKDTNPKDAVGVKKAPISTVSGAVIAEVGLAMLEGARKYGRHNYRISGVRASVYRDATWRHLTKWWEGEDIDPDSGLDHIVKAIASLTVLRDAVIFDNWVDDRPPPVPEGFFANLDKLAAQVIEKYPNAKDPFTHEHAKKPKSK